MVWNIRSVAKLQRENVARRIRTVGKDEKTVRQNIMIGKNLYGEFALIRKI